MKILTFTHRALNVVINLKMTKEALRKSKIKLDRTKADYIDHNTRVDIILEIGRPVDSRCE